MDTSKFRRSTNVEDDRSLGNDPLETLRPSPISISPGIGSSAGPSGGPTVAASFGLSLPSAADVYGGSPTTGVHEARFQEQLAKQYQASQPPQWLDRSPQLNQTTLYFNDAGSYYNQIIPQVKSSSSGGNVFDQFDP